MRGQQLRGRAPLPRACSPAAAARAKDRDLARRRCRAPRRPACSTGCRSAAKSIPAGRRRISVTSIARGLPARPRASPTRAAAGARSGRGRARSAETSARPRTARCRRAVSIADRQAPARRSIPRLSARPDDAGHIGNHHHAGARGPPAVPGGRADSGSRAGKPRTTDRCPRSSPRRSAAVHRAAPPPQSHKLLIGGAARARRAAFTSCSKSHISISLVSRRRRGASAPRGSAAKTSPPATCSGSVVAASSGASNTQSSSASRARDQPHAAAREHPVEIRRERLGLARLEREYPLGRKARECEGRPRDAPVWRAAPTAPAPSSRPRPQRRRGDRGHLRRLRRDHAKRGRTPIRDVLRRRRRAPANRSSTGARAGAAGGAGGEAKIHGGQR